MFSLSRPWLIVCLLLAAVAVPVRVQAAPRFTPTIISVQPGTVSNATATSFLVTGAGFMSATVSLEGYGVLPTEGTAAVLTAQLPAGVPAGTYAVRVTNGDGAFAILPNALTVLGPTATPAPTQFSRPVLVVQSYGASSPEVAANENYDFEMTLQNAGGATATNIIVTFTSGDFVATVTGGTRAVGNLGPGQTVRFFQPLVSASTLSGKRIATLEVKVSYVTEAGTAYNDTFNLTFPVRQVSAVAGPTATPTPTPTLAPQLRPQLLISAYQTNVEPLTAGTRFVLNITVSNRGNAPARRVVAVLGGGGSAGGGSGGSGTPTAPGGIGAGSGDFSNFAPLDASNVVPVGDLAPGQSASVSQNIIVNATIKPGAFPLKYSFVYQDDRNNGFSDEQVITLLVYQPPIVDVNFYRDPNPIFSQQTSLLPLQIVNLSRNPAVLGAVQVKAGDVVLPVQNAFVGALEAGLPFQLDVPFTPPGAGDHTVTVLINYTDDFNQQRVISKTVTVTAQEGGFFPPDDGGNNGGGTVDPQPPAQEDFFAWLWRLIRGLLGLESGRNTAPSQPAPIENMPGNLPPGGVQILPPPEVIIETP